MVFLCAFSLHYFGKESSQLVAVEKLVKFPIVFVALVTIPHPICLLWQLSFPQPNATPTVKRRHSNIIQFDLENILCIYCSIEVMTWILRSLFSFFFSPFYCRSLSDYFIFLPSSREMLCICHTNVTHRRVENYWLENLFLIFIGPWLLLFHYRLVTRPNCFTSDLHIRASWEAFIE